MLHLSLACLALIGLGLFAVSGASAADDKDKPVVVLDTTEGPLTIELDRAKAPITVENFLKYVDAGYYDNTIFHRVIPGFMIQGGGYTKEARSTRDEKEGRRAPIKNEAGNGLKNERGTLAMARTSDPDSATAQFFINLENNGFLNRDQAQDGFGYAVFGKVIEGMDTVDKIAKVPTTKSAMSEGYPTKAIVIKSAKRKGK
jgi:peptidyl-prolyl cis-trans isomerase A (cyclophilin A)